MVSRSVGEDKERGQMTTERLTWEAPGPHDAYQCWTFYLPGMVMFSLDIEHEPADYPEKPYRFSVTVAGEYKIISGGAKTLQLAHQAVVQSLTKYAQGIIEQVAQLRLGAPAQTLAPRHGTPRKEG